MVKAQTPFADLDEDGHPKRNGTWLNASAHIITAVIGSGVLSLAWAVAQLGWIAGPAALLIFALITWFASMLLVDCNKSPDPITRNRNYTYMDVVKANLGGIEVKLCGLAQYGYLVGATIGYTITCGINMVAMLRTNCFHKYGPHAECHRSGNPYMIIFGCMQLILSQTPNFHKLSFLSILAAIMSFSYAFIGVALSIAKITGQYGEGGNHVRASLTSVTVGADVTSEEKVWNILLALGNIAFAYGFLWSWLRYRQMMSLVLLVSAEEVDGWPSCTPFSTISKISMAIKLELIVAGSQLMIKPWRDQSEIVVIESFGKLTCAGSQALLVRLKLCYKMLMDTLESGPSKTKAMQKATTVAVSVTTLFYVLCGTTGYAAFGNKAPGNLLTGFELDKLFWLVDFANLCIVVHLIGAYQVYAQPFFQFVEKKCADRWPESGFIKATYSIHLPMFGNYDVNSFQLVWRSIYVITTTLVAIILPFFNDFLGLIGAIAFWPLTVFLPTEMHIRQTKIQRFSFTWICFKTLSLICLIVSLLAAAASTRGLIVSFKAFGIPVKLYVANS
ncbi:Amino acid transporter, transmembrane domain [Dillenia turbinata]|uniref:Amino acid transporter, transmembrane domain n=1 Tax=Dillenia turbinata TaxID=194707 RepID=A0AAN8UIP4_9MAGN